MPIIFWLNTHMENLNQILETPITIDTTDPIVPTQKPLNEMAKVKHIFSDNVYIKAFSVPRGVKLYSKAFPDDHVAILAKGTVILDDGKQKIKIGRAHV